jgi:hypothetical protein
MRCELRFSSQRAVRGLSRVPCWCSSCSGMGSTQSSLGADALYRQRQPASSHPSPTASVHLTMTPQALPLATTKLDPSIHLFLFLSVFAYPRIRLLSTAIAICHRQRQCTHANRGRLLFAPLSCTLFCCPSADGDGRPATTERIVLQRCRPPANAAVVDTASVRGSAFQRASPE